MSGTIRPRRRIRQGRDLATLRAQVVRGPASCGPSGAIDYKELVGVSGAFCGNAHFFVAREAAAGWLSSHADETILTLEEGYKLGREIWVDPLLREVD